METILATAFGRRIDIQRGEADELTRVARTFFSQAEEGQVASRDVLVMLNSEPPFSLSLFLSLSLSQYYRSFLLTFTMQVTFLFWFQSFVTSLVKQRTERMVKS